MPAFNNEINYQNVNSNVLSYKEWKLWVKSKHWTIKWFIYLILFRPFIDIFYFLKHLSPILSPLYIIGVLTPLFIIASLSNDRMPKKVKSEIDPFFIVFSFFIFFNSLAVFFTFMDLESFGTFIELNAPVYLYLYCRRAVYNNKELDKLLQTFLYSAIVPGLMMIFEIVIHPIKVEYTRGNIARTSGFYADVLNYSIYMTLSVLILGYFYIKNRNDYWGKKKIRKIMYPAFLICFLGLFKISHMATISIFIVLIFLFILYLQKESKFAAIVFIVISFPVFYFVAKDKIEAQVFPLISKDVEVYQGEKDFERGFNGRFGRWEKFIGVFEDNVPFFFRMIGPSFTFNSDIKKMVVGIHNDYLRISFLTGYVGFFFWMIFLLQIFIKSRFLVVHEKFLITGALAILLLYSVSTVPTVYFPLMYMILSIFSYAVIPNKAKKILNENSDVINSRKVTTPFLRPRFGYGNINPVQTQKPL
jgi:hypothetical protein